MYIYTYIYIYIYLYVCTRVIVQEERDSSSRVNDRNEKNISTAAAVVLIVGVVTV